MSRNKDIVIKTNRFTPQELQKEFNSAFNLLKKSTKKQIILLTDKNINQNKCKHVQNLNNIEISNFDYIIHFDSDETASKFARQIINANSKFMPFGICYPTAEYFHINNTARDVLLKSYNEEKRKYNLADYQNIIQAIEITKDLPGCYLEVGVMYGTSANVAVNYMKEINLNRSSYFLDTYEGFKYTDANKSSDIRWNNTHIVASPQDHINMIKNLLGSENVIKNNIITDDLPGEIKDIVVCNLDVDMYDAVKFGLFKLAPKIVKNGILICEDSGHTPLLLGARVALNEFFKSELGKKFIPIHMESGQTFLIRK